MKKAWFPGSMPLVLVGFVLLVLLGNSLTGCSDSGTSLARVFGTFPGPRDTEQTSRFRNAFNALSDKNLEQAEQLHHFNDAFSRVRSEYIYDTKEKKLIDAAIHGMEKLGTPKGKGDPRLLVEAALDSVMATLDPHSSYLNPDEYRESQVVTSGEFGGLGIEINLKDGFVRVIQPIEDTPAYRAGIKSEDLITHVDGLSIKGKKMRDIVRLLRGRPGSDVRLTISREKLTPFQVTVTRAVIRLRPVKWRLEKNVAVIQLTQFIQNSEEALDKAITQIRARLGNRLSGVVLDLRNNPGGLLSQSVAVTDALLDHGEIVSIRNRRGSMRGFYAEEGDLLRGLPLVVLINRSSASASEIVAGALQDHGRATVMGRRSFGKGSVQTITPLDWAGALRLTTSLYYLPSGRSIQGAGISPDIPILGEKDMNAGREENQPRALTDTGAKPSRRAARTQLPEKDCPAAGAKKDDRILGCALVYLKAGTARKFLSLIGTRQSL